MSDKIVLTKVYTAIARNQYGREIARAEGNSAALAAEHARGKAQDELARTNPAWRWRIVRVEVL